ncbi:MAG: tetratricopeptide repeat protein [Candidatus Omnitrophica bacterium]|nr:tetratricopeptide repeat protein [Candidatus Omnitrophota bacterium]
MKLKTLIFIWIIIFWLGNTAFCLPWKILHEQSESQDLNQQELIVKNNPEDLNNLYLLGLIYFNEYDHQQAKTVFEQMLAIEPDLVEAKWGIAECLRREYRLELSQKMLEEIIDRQPDFFPAFISLSYIKFNLKEYDQAAKLSDRIIRRGKKLADRHTLTRAYLIFAGSKGMIAYNGGLLSAFINGSPVFTNLKRARTLMPDSPEVYYGLGCFYFLAPGAYGGNIDKAKEYLEQAIALDPQIIDAYVRLAQIYKFHGDIDKFDYYLNLALSKEPQNFLANDVKSNTCNFICLEPELGI